MSKKRVAVERSYVILTLKFFRQKNKRAKFFMYLCLKKRVAVERSYVTLA